MRLMTILLHLGIVQMTIATTRREMVKPGTKVLFRWNDCHRGEQSDEDLNRRAAALDEKIAEIMEPPTSSDGKRVQIRSLEDPEMTLGVKRKYLEFIQPLLSLRLSDPMFDQVVVAILSRLEAMISAATSKMMCSFEVSKFTKVHPN